MNAPSWRVALLRTYWRFHRHIAPGIISRLAKPVFGGLHPCNVFNYNSLFFKENLTTDDIVVDVACGTGKLLYDVSPVISKGIGVDYSPENIAICRRSHQHNNLEFVLGDILSLDYAELQSRTGYNTATFSHILEHVESPPTLLTRVNARKVLVSVPSQENWATQLTGYLGLDIRTDVTHFREYNREMLDADLTSAGYSIVQMTFNQEGFIVARAERP